MIISISITLPDISTPGDANSAILDAAKAATFKIHECGIPEVDEEFDLIVNSVYAQSAVIFRPE